MYLKEFEGYLRAYKNDLFLNNYRTISFFKKKTVLNFFFVERLGYLFKKNIFLYVIFNGLMFFLFPFIFLAISFIWSVHYFFAQIRLKKEIISSENIFIYSSRLIVDIAKKAKLLNPSDTILLFPGEKKLDLSIANQISVHQCSSFFIIFKSFFSSFILVFYVLVKCRSINVVYLFLIFKWLYIYNSLSRIGHNKQLFIGNQIDRWAILFDSLPHKNKNIIQHGTLIVDVISEEMYIDVLAFDKITNNYYLEIPFKLRSINKLYAFSNYEAAFLLKGAFINKPTIICIGFDIDLVSIPGRAFQILIIGNYVLNSKFEEDLIKSLQGRGYDILLKEHPLSPQGAYDRMMSLYDFKIISSGHFPIVNLVFSYHSTLAHQYQEKNIKVVFYSEFFDNDNILIESQLDNILANYII